MTIITTIIGGAVGLGMYELYGLKGEVSALRLKTREDQAQWRSLNEYDKRMHVLEIQLGIKKGVEAELKELGITKYTTIPPKRSKPKEDVKKRLEKAFKDWNIKKEKSTKQYMMEQMQRK